MGSNLLGLGSFAGGMALALVAALVLLAGFGFGLTLEGRYRRQLLPLVAALITLVPALGVLVAGRDLGKLEFLSEIDPNSVAAWLQRLATAGIVGLALVRVVGRLFRAQAAHGRRAPADATHVALPLFLGFCAYYLGNTLLPAVFGTVPAFRVQMLYPLVVVGALYASRHYEPSEWLDAVKWSLLALLAGGMLVSAVAPAVTTQFAASEARLPGIHFRYWGLGSNPNSIAPLALLLMLLTLHRPFRWRVVSLAALALGGIVLLLAQSQTTWGAAALVLVPFAVYSVRHRRGARASTHEWTPVRIVTLVGVLGAVAVVLALLMFELKVGTGMRNDFARSVAAARKGQEISDLSGRVQIWFIAIEVWKQNPLFGYGPTLWSDQFRAAWGVPFAFHAHNQFMQSLGAAGIIGLLGLLAYLGTMVVGAARAARASRGLAPALVAVLFVRMATEVPLELSTVLLGDFLYQLTTFVAITGYLLRAERRRLAPQRSTHRRRRRSSRPGSRRDAGQADVEEFAA